MNKGYSILSLKRVHKKKHNQQMEKIQIAMMKFIIHKILSLKMANCQMTE
jgi:hypothetical protein